MEFIAVKNRDYMNHDQIRHLRSLRLLLSQDKAPLGFLLAAGCPLSVRIAGSPLLPDMAGLTKIINDAHATDATAAPYRRLMEELNKAGKDTSNLGAQRRGLAPCALIHQIILDIFEVQPVFDLTI
ncbi:MAG: hypothetical protein VZR24_21015 [Butyrivibrio hungatei]|nr:hypothetical protein [Butyrivibrio hungatei]